MRFFPREKGKWPFENRGSLISVPSALSVFLLDEVIFLTCFHVSFFPFHPLCWPPLFLPFSRHIFALFSLSQSALFCRAKGTAQSLERSSFGMDLATKFGKEIPSRNLREKRSASFEPGSYFPMVSSGEFIRGRVIQCNFPMFQGVLCSQVSVTWLNLTRVRLCSPRS